MNKYKITENEINENNVKSAADLLRGEPRDNKNIFDRLPELIAGKVNGFIDAVISKFADYYNKTEIDGKETALSDRINAKANSVDVYAKSETYTKAETDEAIAQRVTDIGAGDMAKAVYDTNGDGVVDDAEKLNGQPASYYATKTEVETAQTTADNAQTTANAAMPKSGGEFLGDAVAISTNRDTVCLRNSAVTNSEWTILSTDRIVFVRK